MPAFITVQIHVRNHGTQTLEIAPVWRGAALAVHPPVTADGAPVQRGLWSITHHITGLAAVQSLPISRANAVALARAWDARFAELQTVGDAATWPHRDAFRAEIEQIRFPWRETDRQSEPENLWTSLSLAIGRRLSVRAGDTPSIRWRGQWWDAPTDAELSAWTMDSVSETPDGRTVEPDAPDSWLRILGLV